MQPAQSLQRHQKPCGRDVGHEWLDVLPVKDGVPAQVGPRPAGDETSKHGARAPIHADELPSILDAGHHEVMRLDDAATSHIHQVAAEHIRHEQDFARTPLKRAGVERVGLQPHLTRSDLLDVLGPDKHVSAADADLDTGHRRGTALSQLYDEVPPAPELVATWGEHRALEDLRQNDPPLVSRGSMFATTYARVVRAVDLSVVRLVAHQITADAVLHPPTGAAPVPARSSRPWPLSRAGRGAWVERTSGAFPLHLVLQLLHAVDDPVQRFVLSAEVSLHL